MRNRKEENVSKIREWKEDTVTPNFIANRFDLAWGKFQRNVEILQVNIQKREYVVEVYYHGKEATLGLWLSDIPDIAVKAISSYIFKNHMEIKKIYFSHSLRPHGIVEGHNHFRVDLPDDIKDFDALSTSKERYNVRRRIRKFHDEQGEIVFNEYDVLKEFPYDAVRRYFSYKEEEYKIQEEIPKTDDELRAYIKEHDITHVYTMSKEDGTVIAIIFSCEQCPCVYIENITFDIEYKKYFPGILLYDHYLRCLVSKHKCSLFLGGGKWEFKRRYKSHEDHVYECRIYRGALNQWIHKLGEKLKHHNNA